MHWGSTGCHWGALGGSAALTVTVTVLGGPGLGGVPSRCHLPVSPPLPPPLPPCAALRRRQRSQRGRGGCEGAWPMQWAEHL